jgi:hypothetical protein
MELEKSAEQVLPEWEGGEEEMTQTMYEHVNKGIIIKKE